MRSLLRENEVQTSVLAGVLDSAAIEFNIERDAIYVISEGFPFWLAIRPDEKLIRLFTYKPARACAAEDDVVRLSHECARSNRSLAFFAQDGRLCANQDLHFAGGIARKSLLRAVRAFGAIFRAATHEHDNEHILITPGSEEPPLYLN